MALAAESSGPKTALVTGAAQGLGAAFARALARTGADLVLCDVQREVEGVAASLARPGPRALARVADVSSPSEVRALVDFTVAEFGGVDVLVANAGGWRPSHPLDPIDKSLDDYEALVGTNLKGVFLCGRAVIPQMIRQGGGEIVIVSTDHVCTCGAPVEFDHADAPDCPWAGAPPRTTGGGKGMDLYDASKWGLNGLLFSWAQALRPHGIRVNALCMGATDTAMLRSLFGGEEPPEAASWMRPEQVAGVLLDLLAEGRDGRSGETIGIALGHPRVLPERRPPRYWRAS